MKFIIWCYYVLKGHNMFKNVASIVKLPLLLQFDYMLNSAIDNLKNLVETARIPRIWNRLVILYGIKDSKHLYFMIRVFLAQNTHNFSVIACIHGEY